MNFDVIRLNSCYNELGLTSVKRVPKLAQRLLSVTELEDTSIIHIHQNGEYNLDEVNKKVIDLYKFNNVITDIRNFTKYSESSTGYVIFRMKVEKKPDGTYTIPPIQGSGSLLYIPTAEVTKNRVTTEVPIAPVERTFIINAIDPNSHASPNLIIKIKGDKKEIVDAETNVKSDVNFSERLMRCFSFIYHVRLTDRNDKSKSVSVDNLEAGSWQEAVDKVIADHPEFGLKPGDYEGSDKVEVHWNYGENTLKSF